MLFSNHIEPVNTNTPLNYNYSLIVQVYDEFGIAWLKLPKDDDGKLLNEKCQNLILSSQVRTNLSSSSHGFHSISKFG